MSAAFDHNRVMAIGGLVVEGGDNIVIGGALLFSGLLLVVFLVCLNGSLIRA